jgi:RNA recognition motif-containing protein
MNIFIGSLPFSLEEAELKEFFEEYGEVTSAKIITDKFTGRSRGYGFVEMPDDEAAKKAIDALNGSEVSGRTIVVNKAQERRENRRGSDGGRGGYSRGGFNRSGQSRGDNSDNSN